nr:MAG TPA: hypothetical protein [Caudoviricetes sp.]
MDEAQENNLLKDTEPLETNNLSIVKGITLLELDEDIIIAVPDTYTISQAVAWYKKDIGIEEDTEVQIDLVDIKNTGIWAPLDKKYDKEYDLLTALYNMTDFINIEFEPKDEPYNNISIIDGEINKFITLKEYCKRYLFSNEVLKEPKIVCCSNY